MREKSKAKRKVISTRRSHLRSEREAKHDLPEDQECRRSTIATAPQAGSTDIPAVMKESVLDKLQKDPVRRIRALAKSS